MKLINVFAYIVAIFVFLTVGSLMIIVSLGALSMEDALLKVQSVYDNSWSMFQIGISGALFIVIGLIFTKILVKLTRSKDDIIIYGKYGNVNISVKAIDHLVRRIIRKFDSVRLIKLWSEGDGNQLKIKISLIGIANVQLDDLVETIQTELYQRLNKFLGDGILLDLNIKIVKILDVVTSKQKKQHREQSGFNRSEFIQNFKSEEIKL